jgi:hypothetical protein
VQAAINLRLWPPLQSRSADCASNTTGKIGCQEKNHYDVFFLKQGWLLDVPLSLTRFDVSLSAYTLDWTLSRDTWPRQYQSGNWDGAIFSRFRIPAGARRTIFIQLSLFVTL